MWRSHRNGVILRQKMCDYRAQRRLGNGAVAYFMLQMQPDMLVTPGACRTKGEMGGSVAKHRFLSVAAGYSLL